MTAARKPYIRWRETGSGWMPEDQARREADRMRERVPEFEYRVKGSVIVGYRVQARERRDG